MDIRQAGDRIVRAACMIAALVTVACSGGGSGVAVAPVGAPAAPVLPTSVVFTGTTSAVPPASATATNITMPLSTQNGYSGHVTLPVASVPPDLRLQLIYSDAPPSGLPALNAARRSVASLQTSLASYTTSVVYACFTANHIVTLNGAPQYQFQLPPHFAPAGILYYLSFFQAGGWVDGYGGPGVVADTSSSTTVTVAGRFAFVIPADESPICVALHASWNTAPPPVPATPAPVASASPAPSPSPLPSPSPSVLPSPSPSPLPQVLSANPSSLAFSALIAQTFVATQTNYSGSFRAVSADTSVVTVAPGTAAGQFVVTPVCAQSNPGAILRQPRTTGGCNEATTITVAAGNNVLQIPVTITIVAPGPLLVSPASLTLATTATPAPFIATESNYSGAFSATIANSAVATVSAGTNVGQFIVTPLAAGSTTVTVVGGTRTAQVTLTVLAPIVLTFTAPYYCPPIRGINCNPGPTSTLPIPVIEFMGSSSSLSATEAGYSGTFDANLGGCQSEGVVFGGSTAPTNSGQWPLSETGTNGGYCTITVTDTNGQQASQVFYATGAV